MIRHSLSCTLLLLLISVAAVPQSLGQAAEPGLQLNPGDRISYIGNTLADRMQHDAWLETSIHALYPRHDLTFRNLGFAGDEVKTRPRSANFGSPDEWLAKTRADVVFCFFGYNEALRGEAGLADFKTDLADMITGMQQRNYNGDSAPRIVVFSPIAHENLHSPHLPDGTSNNQKLDLYTRAMKDVCEAKGVTFVDLFTPTRELYRQANAPLTLNGVHLLERGNRALADVITKALFGKTAADVMSEAELQRLREAVLEKNYYWFSRYRVVDGYNVYGGRSQLAWHGQSNYDVMQVEMEIFDIMTANRDKRVWAVARRSDLKVVDDNIPPLLAVKTNKPGQLPGERHPYFDGVTAMEKMQLADGMQVNLFASEEMFPEMVNPVQMAVDTDSRLFVSVWPSYPHWNPTQPRTDRIVCLPDEDRDGVADKCIVFADELNSVTGFEFWGGGMLVAAPPEIWFLKDTDGDDKADVKIRMLQGVSSADTHHSANAMVVGPDGWLYWSRGIFNVANMETPTRTYRSGSSGVHRFNPRTFEVEFHFPIGPNPHGDVFDQWGYQFANDGTSGTGSYVNIGKGVGNKQWFQKRVRPVAATGILSSSHFPPENNGNFLICNTIGFLGVLQHKVQYDGADITAVEIEPILVSSDPNFRPTDLEIGGDGALYVSDWCNVLIGHMQHNMRDPNRDHEHGRIYRVTYKGRPLLEPVKLKGKPIETVLQAFFALENATRYRARLELSGRDTNEVIAAVASFTSGLDPANPADAQALLECLWVLEEHRVPNFDLLKKVFQAEEPRVRAAAIRTLGHWGPQLTDWEPTLQAAARDESALVRAEAVKAAVAFEGLAAAEVIFEVANRPTDVELDTVINYARGQINVDRLVQDAVRSGKPMSTAAQTYALRNANVDDLLKLDRTAAVYAAILSRPNATLDQLGNALDGLSGLQKTSKVKLLIDLIESRDAEQETDALDGLGELLTRQPAGELRSLDNRLKQLAIKGNSTETRQLGFAAWIAAEGSPDGAFEVAMRDKDRLRDVLEAIPRIPSDEVRGVLYAKVRPLMFALPGHVPGEDGVSSSREAMQDKGIRVDYFEPNPPNVALETLAKLEPQASGVVPEITLDVPQLKRRDGFALRFSGTLQIDKAGRYRFFTNSDDGSRLYIGDELVVDNDGDHGMVEKRGGLRLSAGSHPLVVTYYDQGGGDGLTVSWSGPGFEKQPIPGAKLSVAGADTIQDVAIRSLASIPGHEKDKFADLATLIEQEKHRTSAVRALLGIPTEYWPQEEIRPLAESLAAYVSEIPAKYRTGKPALEAMQLTDTLASLLPEDQARLYQARLAELKVNVIRIGTVLERMIYDKERLVIEAGKPVEFVFTNTDNMPHNFSIVQPGALEEIGLLAEATAREPDAMARHYVPKSDKILLSSHLLQPTETQALSFEAPTTPGVYPYVCTYPGHWRRMYGALYVVADLKQYLADPVAYLASHPLTLQDELLKYTARNTEWTFDELAMPVTMLAADHSGPAHSDEPRQFDVGKSIFRVANCVACHRLNGEGYEFGPDLANLDPQKRDPEYILRSLLEPSRDIDEKYQAYGFALASGQIMTGLVVEETPTVVKVAVDPISSSEPTVLKKSDIEERTKSTVSTMPKGLLNKLSREEILDLISYVYAGGDMKHPLFAAGHQHEQ